MLVFLSFIIFETGARTDGQTEGQDPYCAY